MGNPCTFSSLRDKEIVNTADGSRLGFACDLEIDPTCGKICSLLVPERTRLFKPGKCREITIPWNCIIRIGDDLILVCLPVDQKEKRDKKDKK